MLWFDREQQASPSAVFEAQVEAMNSFAVAFGEIHRKRSWGEGMAAFNMLQTATGFSPLARDTLVDALATEFGLPALPASAKASLMQARNMPDTGKFGRDFVNSVSAVFMSLSNPDKPSDVYVAALVKKSTGFGATPTFFMATPEEVAQPQKLMAKAEKAYSAVRESRQQQRAALG